jgi:hypothetical protein
MSAIHLILLLSLLGGEAVTPAPTHEDGKKGVVVSGKVYLGEKASFTRAVTIDQKKVFEAIPAYQSIKKENVEKDTARYHFLIQEANRVFKEALKKLAKEKGFDLVVEKDGIKIPGESVSDMTQSVIDAIE